MSSAASDVYKRQPIRASLSLSPNVGKVSPAPPFLLLPSVHTLGPGISPAACPLPPTSHHSAAPSSLLHPLGHLFLAQLLFPHQTRRVRWRSQVFPFPLQEHQQREWAMMSNTICLSYSKIIVENKGAIFMYLDGILALVLQHYHNCIVEKILPAYSASQASLLCHLSFSPPTKNAWP